jgi:glucose-6-phosphate isomerase
MQNYVQSVALCYADNIAGMGVGRDELEAELSLLNHAVADTRHADTELAAVFNSARSREDLASLNAFAEDWRSRFSRIVVFGIGGSSLGARTVLALKPRQPGDPEIVISDNLDSAGVADLLDPAGLSETGFLVISKSGGTAETLSQAIAAISSLRQVTSHSSLRDRVICMAEEGDNPLRKLATRIGAPVIDHDPNLGGRFSVLSTAVLPALFRGMNAEALRDGALEVIEACLATEGAANFAPSMGAAVNVALQKTRGLNQAVIKVYHDRMHGFGLWHRQLWAESLGKSGFGTTPINAVGPVDQHSQLQLYLDGPVDKFFTVLAFNHAGLGPKVDSSFAAEIGLDYLGDKQIGDIVGAMQRATIETLAKRGRPVRTLSMQKLDEATLGALFMHFMLETVFSAKLWGVNPFGQPAVEESKILARHYLSETK